MGELNSEVRAREIPARNQVDVVEFGFFWVTNL